jgi:hypothetical protein
LNSLEAVAAIKPAPCLIDDAGALANPPDVNSWPWSEAGPEKNNGRRPSIRERISNIKASLITKRAANPDPEGAPEEKRMAWLAIPGLICSVLGPVFFATMELVFLFLSLLSPLLGILLSGLALRAIRKHPGKRKGKALAIAGWYIGIGFLSFLIILYVLLVIGGLAPFGP